MFRTQVVIIGAGPSGLLLAQLLHLNGVESIVMERQARQHVEARSRAGLLEWGTVDLLKEAGVGGRMMREGMMHDGFELTFDGRSHRIDLQGLTGQRVMVYGQTEIQKDLTEARATASGQTLWEAKDVVIEEFDGRRARVHCRHDGQAQTYECDFVAGCDGYHGISRASVPQDLITLHERTYSFGWLGVLADVPPAGDELIYANHPRGFALCSMRSKTRSRYYIQCPLADTIEDWPDSRFWDELCGRLPAGRASLVNTGPAIEKSIVPLRSVVAEPMRFGRLFLVGDAAHIVPPTGAKGLNLAAADVRVLYQAIVDYYRTGSDTLLGEYSSRALKRVWRATRFSGWFTSLMHKFSDDPFTRRLQLAELDYLTDSRAASQVVAENYAGSRLGMPRA